MIHPTAIIDESVKIGKNVQVGPWTIIGPNVVIGDDTVIYSHVVIRSDTVIGRGNQIFQFSSIGEDSADMKYKGEVTRLIIGDYNIIREGVSIHRGTVQDKKETHIGNHNLLMAYVHVGHDCIVGNHIILVNNTALAGHVVIKDYARLSGYTLVHQGCCIGEYSFTGMGSGVKKDVPAYVMVYGNPAQAKCINTEGLVRANFEQESIKIIKQGFKIIYRQGHLLAEAIDLLEKKQHSALAPLIHSLKGANRGITR